MGLIYPASTGHNVDDKYSPLVEPNLFAGKAFQPGISFTDKYQLGPGGQIIVHKPSIDVISATAPGADFSHVINQDALITISLNKQFNRSRKIYNATAASVAYPIAAAEMELAALEVGEGWQAEALTSLAFTTSLTVSDNILTLTATDGSDIYDQIVADRQKLRLLKAKPDTMIVSPVTYSKLLKSPEFQRTGAIGDKAVSDGIVGRVAGMNVIEYENTNTLFADADVIGGITWVVANDDVEYFMYEKDAYSIVTSLSLSRVIDHPDFNGTLAQVETVSGYKVTNVSRALVKLHDASAT
jgi:hypothetical protein